MQATSLPGNVLKTLGSEYVVEAITSEEALWAAKDDWERLADRTTFPNVFTTWGWIWTWWCVLGRTELSTRLFVITARKDREFFGILPLVTRNCRWFNLRKLEYPDKRFADYMDPLLIGDPAGILTAMFAFLADQGDDWDLLFLRHIRCGGGADHEIPDSLSRAGLMWRQRKDESYLWLPITGNWEQMRSPRSGQRFRAKLKRFQSAGFNCRILEHPEKEPGLLERMAAVERRRMVNGNPAGLSIAEHPDFYAHLFEILGPPGWLYVGVVEKAGNLIGYEFGFRCGSNLWVSTKGYDASCTDFSPGNILTAAVIDYGFEHGYVEYDMLAGIEEFKLRMTNLFHEQIRFEVWNRSVRSRLGSGLHHSARVSRMALLRLLGRPIHPDL